MLRVLALVVLGLAMVVFRNAFAVVCIRFQNEVFGFRFGDSETAQAKFAIVFAGIAMLVLAVIDFLK
jgi:hypothetical protein